MEKYDAVIKSPIGHIGILAEADRITGVRLVVEGTRERMPREGVAADAARALKTYFRTGQWPAEIPLQEQGTEFQKRVWGLLRTITPGTTLTYGEVARRLQTSPRAIGQACRTNPCPILTPCHRVVAANGTGGFSGEIDGEWPGIKAWLLRHEGYIA
ncbi:MAG: methylated-DNA--[protein]-cysteine S-methyltransferase [Chromatiales bacterium]|jgi:methylated-DNA-[protein]-cysteine S-methyltransferase